MPKGISDIPRPSVLHIHDDVALPISSVGTCMRSYKCGNVDVELGNGLCMKCWDKSLERSDHLALRYSRTPKKESSKRKIHSSTVTSKGKSYSYYRQSITIGGKRRDIKAKTKTEWNQKVMQLLYEKKILEEC